MSDAPVLEIRNLKKYFSQDHSLINSLLGKQVPQVQAVDDVSFTLDEKESIGIIGESGCGKSTLLKTLMGLQDSTDGEILFKGDPISEFDKRDWKRFRRSIQMIFQDPFNSLDPKLTVEDSLKEPLKVHGIENKDERVRHALEQVELRPPEKYLNQLPNQMSGGEKQRVSIARAIVLEPDVLLADEPVSMLDVSTQASILNLLSRLIEDLDVTLLYISHDLSTVSYVCDSISVMYLGWIVENGPTDRVLNNPKHPYTQALINAIPIPDPHHERERTTLESTPLDPIDLGDGCRFRDRCPDRMPACNVTPDETRVGDGHCTACHLYYDHEMPDNLADGRVADSD